MPGYQTITNSASANLQIGVGTAGDVIRTMDGDPTRVKVAFVSSGKTRVQFDCVLTETHSVEAAPTVFPIEDGQTVSDHITVAPLELSLSGIVSDTPLSGPLFGNDPNNPLNGGNGLIQEGVTSGANALAGPLGVLAASAGFATLAATRGVSSPSTGAFYELVRMAAGDPTAKPPVAPVPFNVVTRLKLYKNMVIKSLQVPRDSTTGKALVFNITLTQLILVQPRTIALTGSSQPDPNSIKQKLSEEPVSEEEKEFLKKRKVGITDTGYKGKVE